MPRLLPFDAAEFARRHAGLLAGMRARGLDAVILNST